MRPLNITIACIAALLPSVAGATPTFPQVIADKLGLAKPPDCIICHLTNQGGAGTSVRPFSLYLQSRGLRPFDEASLRAALDAAAAEHHDSNGNGVDDIDELKQGHDPNPAAGEQPRYGCGARIASSHHEPSSAALLAVCAGLLLARRRPRR
jgi:hypothetical protein